MFQHLPGGIRKITELPLRIAIAIAIAAVLHY
jgi:hypothetical protein